MNLTGIDKVFLIAAIFFFVCPLLGMAIMVIGGGVWMFWQVAVEIPLAKNEDAQRKAFEEKKSQTENV